MHTVKSLKDKKNYIVFSYNKKIQKFVLTFILAFIKVMRTRPIFQKKIFCFLLLSGVTTLYVRRIPDIKFFC
jgi:hypothetical protein